MIPLRLTSVVLHKVRSSLVMRVDNVFFILYSLSTEFTPSREETRGITCIRRASLRGFPISVFFNVLIKTSLQYSILKKGIETYPKLIVFAGFYMILLICLIARMKLLINLYYQTLCSTYVSKKWFVANAMEKDSFCVFFSKPQFKIVIAT